MFCQTEVCVCSNPTSNAPQQLEHVHVFPRVRRRCLWHDASVTLTPNSLSLNALNSQKLINTTKLMINKEPEEGATVSRPDPVTVFYYTYMIKRIIINRNVCLLCRTHPPVSCLSNDFPSVKAMLVTSMEKNCNSPGQCKCFRLKFPFFFFFPALGPSSNTGAAEYLHDN